MVFRFRSQFVIVIAVAALVGACSGTHTPATAIVPGSPLSRNLNHRGSWMLPGAGKKWLLYASDEYGSTVDIYDLHSHPLKLYGQITGLSLPVGECVDDAGNVYIADFGSDEIYQFAHGATTWSVQESDLYGRPFGCAYDRTTGNIAVSNLRTPSGYSGDVIVFSGGLTGYQTAYSSPAIKQVFPGGYDPHGNFFVAGTNYSAASVFVELPAGSSKFTVLKGLQLIQPTNVQWDGLRIAVTDQNYQNGGHTAFYQVNVKGSRVRVVRATVLTDTCSSSGDYTDVVLPLITGKRHNEVIGGNQGCSHRFDFWKYPAGGDPYRFVPPPIAPDTPAGESISPPAGHRVSDVGARAHARPV